MSYPTREEMLEKLHKAMRGTRRIAVTFRRGKEIDIVFLWGMRKKGMILLEETGNMLMDILVSSIENDRNFVGEENSPITIVLAYKFDEYHFLFKMSDSFAKFEVVE